MLTDGAMRHVHSAADPLRHRQVWLCRINEGLGHRIDRQLAGNLASFMATKAVGHYQHSAMQANVVVEQLRSQLIVTNPDHFTGQIDHHEVVLVVVALQPPVGEAEDHDLDRKSVV